MTKEQRIKWLQDRLACSGLRGSIRQRYEDELWRLLDAPADSS